MPSKFSSLVLYSIFWITIISCDDSLTPKDYNVVDPYVQELTINPSNITFHPVQDGQKDTTISLNISVKGFNFETDSVPYYSIFFSGSDLPFIQGKFLVNLSSLTTFQANVAIPTNTIRFESYTILVTPTLDGSNQNYAQSIIKQTGVPINAPEILEVNNPEEVEIPNDDSRVRVRFKAKVIDPDGQNNIDRVLLEFVNPDGSILIPEPTNRLLDNGENSNTTSQGDEIAGDSVYTIQFFINSSNTSINRTARYFAIDKSGLRSDTLEAPFNLVDNE